MNLKRFHQKYPHSVSRLLHSIIISLEIFHFRESSIVESCVYINFFIYPGWEKNVIMWMILCMKLF